MGGAGGGPLNGSPLQVLHFLNGGLDFEKKPVDTHADRIVFNVSGKRFETTIESLDQ